MAAPALGAEPSFIGFAMAAIVEAKKEVARAHRQRATPVSRALASVANLNCLRLVLLGEPFLATGAVLRFLPPQGTPLFCFSAPVPNRGVLMHMFFTASDFVPTKWSTARKKKPPSATAWSTLC